MTDGPCWIETTSPATKTGLARPGRRRWGPVSRRSANVHHRIAGVTLFEVGPVPSHPGPGRQWIRRRALCGGRDAAFTSGLCQLGRGPAKEATPASMLASWRAGALKQPLVQPRGGVSGRGKRKRHSSARFLDLRRSLQTSRSSWRKPPRFRIKKGSVFRPNELHPLHRTGDGSFQLGQRPN